MNEIENVDSVNHGKEREGKINITRIVKSQTHDPYYIIIVITIITTILRTVLKGHRAIITLNSKPLPQHFQLFVLDIVVFASQFLLYLSP